MHVLQFREKALWYPAMLLSPMHLSLKKENKIEKASLWPLGHLGSTQSGNRNFIFKSSAVILQWGRIFSLVFLNFYITTAEVGKVVVGSSPASYDICKSHCIKFYFDFEESSK